jgi:hypothetical protein
LQAAPPASRDCESPCQQLLAKCAFGSLQSDRTIPDQGSAEVTDEESTLEMGCNLALNAWHLFSFCFLFLHRSFQASFLCKRRLAAGHERTIFVP